ncbi:TonB-dependent receptor [Hymenobacter pini]|uniref:TonB-dependent receptor n=1 Tax=Hymenobacter pini TaxID=2880879 RepID=UPI001CF5CC6F|nr:TonB-dependent receptor [Hymenobacter pini]MCA8829954.1 TonB-dependent receptor [Hymenobacter pini]
MKKNYLLILSAATLCASLPAYSQTAPPTPSTTSTSEVSLETYIKQVEASTPYRFFYLPDAIRTVKVPAQLVGQPVAAVLEQALKGTKLHAAVDAQNRIFLTEGAPLQTTLPEGFFIPLSSGSVAVADDAPDDATEEEAARQRARSAVKLYEVGIAPNEKHKGMATLTGHVRDIKSGEPIIGAAVFVESPNIGATTDQFGTYSITLPLGRHELKIRGIGINNTKRLVVLRGDGRLEIEVEEDITPLREVVIEAEKDKNVASTQMGVEKLDIRTIKQVPTAFGEADILRVVLTLPGVKSVGEGSTGLNVRGGAVDQNLILFNDATIYNPSHLFGFFSAFNPDVIKSVELYKSAIPAKYGGRLSSVLDITTRDGNKKKFSGAGGIGLLTSRLSLEGPIQKDKSSFLIGGRTSYSNWLLQKIPNSRLKESAASFYDLNVHLTHEFSEKDAIYLTGYSSQDRFRLASDTVYQYRNLNASAKWRHTFNNKLFGVLTGTATKYGYNIQSTENPVNASELKFSLEQQSAHADFTYFVAPKHTLDFGGSSVLYNIQSGSLQPLGEKSLITPDALQREKGLESALYISDKIDFSQRFSVSVGLRYSLFNALGPRTTYNYLPNISKSETTITDTVTYANNKVLATYHGPEYRLSMRYALTDVSSVKLSYNRTRQYIHLLSNTTSMSPTDVWKLSDGNIRPQVGDQYSVGYYRNFKNNTIETSIETYWKNTRDFVDYKSGATLLLNHHIETDVINALGKAYGVEVMVRKLTGKLNGWASYTYSRSLVQVNNPATLDFVNGGKFYASNFDKPHDFTMISNYRFSRRFSTSFNFTYSTGRPITLPLAKYYIGGATRVYYSDRNAYRVPDYYRMDFGINMEGNHKVKKLAHSSLSFSVYNLTGRRNPYSVYFKTVNGQIRGYKLSVFGAPIPTITYNFKF